MCGANTIGDAHTIHDYAADEQHRSGGVECGDTHDHRFDCDCDTHGCEYATYRRDTFN